MGQVVDYFILCPVQSRHLSIGLLDFLGKSGVFDGKGHGSADHIEKIPVGLLEITLFFIDAAQHANDSVDTL